MEFSTKTSTARRPIVLKHRNNKRWCGFFADDLTFTLPKVTVNPVLPTRNCNQHPGANFPASILIGWQLGYN